MNIKEVRQKYPQYEDLSDVQLADALHGKFYADMPKADFYKRIGLSTDPVAQPEESGLAGIAAEGGKGLLRGASNLGMMIGEGIAGLVPGVGPYLKEGVKKLAEPSRRLVAADPKNDAEKFAGTTGELAGAAIAGGGASTVGRAVTQVALPAVSGAIGEQLDGERGKFIGAVAVPLVAGAGLGAAKNAITKKVSQNLETFRQAGATPTVGQATEISFIRGLENLISKFPGGVGVMRKFSESQQAGFGAKARTGVSAEDAGRAIEKGVGGFLERTKAAWSKLDDELAAKVPAASRFAPSNTVQALDDLTKPIAGAEKTSASLVNQKLADIQKNLADDLQANNGVVPFEALRALRSKVGSMLDDALVSGIPGGELKKVYGSLSKDMEQAATTAGAGAAFARQNNYYRSRMDRLEGVLERVVGKNKLPEDVFKSFNPTDPDQANKVRAVLRSLSPTERMVVSEAVLNRMGRATPGKQSDIGEVFSSETFLTNWNKISEGAKAQLFPNHSMRANINAIAKASNNIREGSRAFANPSGTAGAAAPYGLGAMAATGNIGPAAAMIGSAYVGAKMLTNPKVVEWLARSGSVRAENMAPHLARLGSIYKDADDGLREELGKFISSIGTEAQ